MRVAVTGAGGFVGSALAARLREEGHTVAPLSRAELAEADFRAVDAVVHCAALAHRTGAERPDADAFDAVNHRLTVDLAQKARQSGVRRFVFVSTIHTVADNPQPLTPDMPLAPRAGDDYACAKARAETALMEMTGIEIVVARPTLVYGPGARANLRALARLCDSGLPLPFGAARNRRSFVSLENTARALAFLATTPHEKLAGQVFHLAEPEPRSTREVATKLRRALDRPPRLLPVPPPLMKAALMALGRKALYEQLFGDLVADGTALTTAGFAYLPGDPQLEAMAKAARRG